MSAQEPVKKQRSGSAWSFRIATIAGIPLRIHFTFLLFLFWIAMISQRGGGIWSVLVVSVFVCVVLHEFGHALVARKFGVSTRDITLYPIGGVAVLEGRLKPRQELYVALAGPAVNVVIAVLLGVYIVGTEGRLPSLSLNLLRHGYLHGLFVANVVLVLFNMIPAFPMDGGRVLRSALGLRMPEERATQIAGTIGQGLAIAFGFYGILDQQIILVLISFFVYIGAGQEMATTRTLSFLQGHRVSEAMQTRYRTLESGMTLEAAANTLLAGSQHDFPVTFGDEVLGVLTRTDIARGLATEGPTGYVAGFMQREYRSAAPDMPLEEALELFTVKDSTPVLVMEDGKLTGMVTQENLSEFIMLEHARRQSRSHI